MSTYNGQLSNSNAEKFDREISLSTKDLDLILKWYYAFLDENKDFFKLFEEQNASAKGRISKYYIPDTHTKIKSHFFKDDIERYILWSNSVFTDEWKDEDETLLNYLTLASKNEHLPKKDEDKNTPKV